MGTSLVFLKKGKRKEAAECLVKIEFIGGRVK